MVKGKILDLGKGQLSDTEQELFNNLSDAQDEEETSRADSKKKEEKVAIKRLVKQPEAAGDEEPKVLKVEELSIDSPSSLWDLGHVVFKFKDLDTDGVDAAILQAQEKFEAMRQELLSQPAMATIKAINYGKALVAKADEDPDEYDWAAMTAQDVTELIEQMGGAKEPPEKKPFRGKSSGGRSSGKKSYRSRNFSGGSGKQGGNFNMKNPDAPMTKSQSKRIESDCEDAGEDLPDGFDDFTMQEASNFIQEMASK